MIRIFIKYILFFVLFVVVNNLQAQEFTKEDEYKQVMENAKVAFEAKKYSEAIMFYKHAQKLNPESHLPRYKIEDIRTIYIERELEKADMPEPQKKKPSKRELAAKKEIEKQAEEEAERKMNEDAEEARKELENLRKELQSLDINEEPELVDEKFDVDDVVRTKETPVEKMESKQVSVIEETETPALNFEKREIPEIEFEKEALKLNIDSVEIEAEEEIEVDDVVETVKVKEKKTEVVVTTIVKKPVEKAVKKISEMTPEEKEAFVEAEQERLTKKYPKTKTVEEIEKPGKHITRVIMNIENKVTIYMKVKHSWGATYYFVDKPGQELQSINEVFFNRMTNLKTYGY